MDDLYFNLVKEKSKRLLCLDTQDLCLLPTCYDTWVRDNPGLLWSCKPSRYDKKECYEFFTESECSKDSQVSTHTFCYLCNAVVPTAYVTQHVNSSKHVAYQRIAKVGLERMRQQRHITGIDSMKGNSEYFCEHCLIVIKSNVSSQIKHEKSEAHKQFVKIDVFLNDFASFYATNDPAYINYSKVDDKRDSNEDDWLETKDNQDFDVLLLRVHTEELNKDSVVDNKLGESKKLMKTVDSCLDPESEVNNIVEARLDAHNEINIEVESPADAQKVMINKVESPPDIHKKRNIKLEAGADVYEKINKQIEMLLDKTLGMDYKDESHSESQKGLINNMNGKHEHSDECDNLESYIKALKEYGTVKLHKFNTANDDRVRIETEDACELNVSLFSFDGLRRTGKNFHCKICNTTVKSICAHRQLEKHMAVVAQPFKDKHCIRPLRGAFSHCVVCNEVINNVVVHSQLESHLKRVEKALVQVNPLTCISSTNNVATKPADSEKKTADTPEMEETVANININKVYCFPCDTYMHINNLVSHFAGSKHVMNAKAVISDCMSKSAKNKLTCKVCQTSFYNNRAADEHIATFVHIKNYNDCLATNEVIKSKDKLFCKSCGKKIIRTRELSHVESHSHKVKLASYKVDSIDKNDIIRNIEIKFLTEDKKTMEIPTKNNEEELNAGDKTNDKPDNPSIEVQNDKGTVSNKNNEATIYLYDSSANNNELMVCNDTRVKELKSSITEVMESKAWKAKIPNYSCNKRHPKNSKNRKYGSTLTAVNDLLGDVKNYLGETLDMTWQKADEEKSEVNCLICNVKITFADIERHIHSRDHVLMHREFLYTNKLKFKKDRYVCYLCGEYITFGKESRHIASDGHTQRMEALNYGIFALVKAKDKGLIDEIRYILNDKVDKADLKPITFSDVLSDPTIDVTELRQHFCELYGDESRLVCVLCQVVVENSEAQYQVHTKNVVHQTRYAVVLNYNKIFKIQNGFVCGYCENIVTDELAHTMHDRHLLYLDNDPRKNYCSVCHLLPLKDFAIKDHVTSKSHLKNLGVPFDYYCNICNLQLIDKDDNIEKHNASSEHENNSSIIDDNKVILNDHNCECDVCEVTFSRDEFDGHIYSVTHAMLLHNNHYQIATADCSNVED